MSSWCSGIIKNCDCINMKKQYNERYSSIFLLTYLHMVSYTYPFCHFKSFIIVTFLKSLVMFDPKHHTETIRNPVVISRRCYMLWYYCHTRCLDDKKLVYKDEEAIYLWRTVHLHISINTSTYDIFFFCLFKYSIIVIFLNSLVMFDPEKKIRDPVVTLRRC